LVLKFLILGRKVPIIYKFFGIKVPIWHIKCSTQRERFIYKFPYMKGRKLSLSLYGNGYWDKVKFL